MESLIALIIIIILISFLILVHISDSFEDSSIEIKDTKKYYNNNNSHSTKYYNLYFHALTTNEKKEIDFARLVRKDFPNASFINIVTLYKCINNRNYWEAIKTINLIIDNEKISQSKCEIISESSDSE